MKLKKAFFMQEDVVSLSQQLIGKVLVSRMGNSCCSGIISETEAYNGIGDKASHAYGGRRTRRTEIMYSEGGVAYVFLCYGIHNLFNVVSGRKDIPQAVLIRSIIPLEGIAVMEERRNIKYNRAGFSNGPGKVCSALGIQTRHSGISLTGKEIWIEDHQIPVKDEDIIVTERIGVAYAGEDFFSPIGLF